MLALMLELRFKNLRLMSSFIGHHQGVAIVEQYNMISLYPMFMKCYYHLHPSIESINEFANQRMDDDNNLDIFQMTIRNIKPSKDLVIRKLLVFQRYQVDVKEIKCSL
jgi:hypothetical protein